MSRITEVFNSARKSHGLLISYTMGGYPSNQSSFKVAQTLVEAGSDILELGIPFSDPIADGPSIQKASAFALSSGTRPIDVLELVSRLRRSYDTPLVLMTYYNIVYSSGIERFVKKAKESGADGLVIPDLLVEEADMILALGMKQGMDIILLASPVTREERLKRIAKSSMGFLYLISVLGVTGARDKLSANSLSLLRFVKANVKELPVAVGFGVSKPDHVRQLIKNGADAVVVGSAIINRINQERALVAEDSSLDELKEFTRELKSATFLA